MVNLKRIDKASELVDKGLIEIIFEDETMIQFKVYSLNSRQRSHIVSYDGVRFSCLCGDGSKRNADCYHKVGCSYFLRDLRREGQTSLEDKKVKEGFISPETLTGGVI
jgi:hypothetical protein